MCVLKLFVLQEFSLWGDWKYKVTELGVEQSRGTKKA
jgi:hypothetical protein